MDKLSQVLGGIFGVAVGDALGVPVEFELRECLKKKPVKEMQEYGTHHQSKGTWSDDTSLTLCLAESLNEGFDLEDIADRFCMWYDESYLTPRGVVFDIGTTTQEAIENLLKGESPLKSGISDEYSNGNGALMRILPMAFHVENMDINKGMELIHQAASITHPHPRNNIACGIYVQIAVELLKGRDKIEGITKGIEKAVSYYLSIGYKEELNHYKRIMSPGFFDLKENDIKSSIYVVDTLEAALWCFANGLDYKDIVLKAVNLGMDTDTIAAISGGIAGIYYGYTGIPYEWIDIIARRDDIKNIAVKLYLAVYKPDMH